MLFEQLRNTYKWAKDKPDVKANEKPRYYDDRTTNIIKSLIKTNKDRIIELGCWLGTGTKAFADLIPNGYIACVDTWVYEYDPNPLVKDIYPIAYETFLINCWNIQERIIPLKMRSHSALGILSYYDFAPNIIYIDAAHDYESVLSDIELSIKLFPDAKIVGDDSSWQSVMMAVNDISQKYKKKLFVIGNTWWFE